MTDFVQLWVYLSSTPLFGLNATLVVYVLALAFYTRMGQAPWANPVLWSMVVLGLGLLATGTAYPTYFAGAQFIHFLLGPAVVALAWPLWERRAELRVRWGRFTLASVVGGAAAAGSAVGLAWALGLPLEIVLSLAPKSVTAPVAMGIADKIGGNASLAAVFAVVTGLVGALSGKTLFTLLGIGTDATGWMARGFAMGTAAHGIGAARALQVHQDAGAWAALALGLQVVTASLLIPLIAGWF
ncbi:MULTISPECIES: LrgB family protein [unclassified Simplicispira]|jgi:putative effector of murein hydrolase|uniref:LrgB family protein n=1 Tax=unclassified Simplicispira TaxID=2630407 RepID=UPI000D5DCF58|nr:MULTISPECIES: LrgB family protein [unclassified Simplicispira]MBH1979037.1 LrgB family protein [Comamonadaceae bacterium]PVY58080.1 putative effector of murein hydrolase [Simplicispira sp. 125]REG19024.1 putative effector of murein hydrolase [Simplicispira sp. 110]